MTRPNGLLPGPPLGGTEMVGDLNNWLEALAELFSDPTPPPFSVEQMIWQDTSVSPPELRQRRGGVWVPFGFGGFRRNPPVVDTDWNAVDTEGCSVFTSDVAPNMPSATIGWYCIQLRRSGGAKVQMAWRVVSDDVRIRRFYNGVWYPWRRLIGDHNLVGAVSETGGVPTGAVIESGSNANGLFTKWADGTMICRTPAAGLVSGAASASGALFGTTTAVTWTYPQAFVAVPVVNGSFDAVPNISWLIADSVTATTAALRGASSATFTSGTMFAQATGRWF